MAPSTNPFEPMVEEDEQLTPITTKSYFRATSNLTLSPATMESLSRTTTAAGTPLPADPETPASTHPFSAFYSHPQCAVSSETRRIAASKESLTRMSWEKDIEKGGDCPIVKPPGTAVTHATLGSNMTPVGSARPSCERSLTTTQSNNSTGSFPMKTMSPGGKDQSYCTVWPAGDEVRQRKKDARRMKGCLLFRNLSRKQKIIAKICIGILILGIATVIGVCISYKTGGLVWKSSNEYGAIGS